VFCFSEKKEEECILSYSSTDREQKKKNNGKSREHFSLITWNAYREKKRRTRKKLTLILKRETIVNKCLFPSRFFLSSSSSFQY